MFREEHFQCSEIYISNVQNKKNISNLQRIIPMFREEQFQCSEKNISNVQRNTFKMFREGHFQRSEKKNISNVQNKKHFQSSEKNIPMLREEQFQCSEKNSNVQRNTFKMFGEENFYCSEKNISNVQKKHFKCSEENISNFTRSAMNNFVFQGLSSTKQLKYIRNFLAFVIFFQFNSISYDWDRLGIVSEWTN